MRPSLTITPVAESELSELAKVAARSYADAYGHVMSAETMQRALKNTRSLAYFQKSFRESKILVAKQNNRIVGYVQYGKVKIPEAEAGQQDRLLDRLYVDPAAYRQGIGRQLAEAALEDPEMAAAPRVFLQVGADNERAISLYRRLGFERVGITRFTNSDGTQDEDEIMVRQKM